jgi:periplasmic protein TonB
VMDVNPSAAPVEAPREIKPETGFVEQERVATVSGDIGGVVGGIPGGVPEAPPPPPPPPAPVRVGGNIQAPKKVKDVNPVYPPIAQSARVQGVVILEATIGPNGNVQDVRVLRSIPLLDAAAIEAVKQWSYTPTLLNGVPVPVIMTVTVNFTLR